jgi:hypothetical protein
MPGRARIIIHDSGGYELDGQHYDDILSLAAKELHIWRNARLPIVHDGDLAEVVGHVRLKDIAAGRVDFDKLLAGEPSEIDE